jgi:uncharacterized protein (DUF1499 family)
MTANEASLKWLMALLLGLALASLALELLAGPAYRLGWLALKPALQTLRWAAAGAAVVFVLSLLLRTLVGRRLPAAGRWYALAASLVALLAFAPPAYLWSQANRLPRIHDVSTDTQDPPAFVALLEQRRNAPNGLTYTQEVAAQQKQGYPDIVPLRMKLPAGQAFSKAEHVATSMGWDVQPADPATLRIEATATTRLFGFKDDVVIRIRPDGEGSRVDVRSVSRVGGSDIGANAARIRSFLDKLRQAQ